MTTRFPHVLLVALTAALASCGQVGQPQATLPQPSAPQAGTARAGTEQPGAATLQALAVASPTTLTVGQTRQFNVTVGGQPAQPGQLSWTTTNAGVATVTQTGLVTAKAAGSATVRATLVSSPSAFIDFPITVTASTSGGGAGGGSTPTGTFAQRVLSLTNTARATARTCGTTSYAAAAPLAYNTLLEKAAQAHANDMATKNYFSHTSQDGRTFSQRISAAGYTWTRVAENIAAGYATPEAVVQSWLQSPGHCANIMNPSLKELGVGYAYNASSSYGHYWVQDFGTR